MSDIVIKNAAEIATPTRGVKRGAALKELQVIPGGSVYCKDGSIRALGKFEEIEREITGNSIMENLEVIDARGKTVIPGFIDAHTHLVFAGTREDEFSMRISGATYQEIAERGGGIKKTVQDTRRASTSELVATAGVYLQRALHSGTTTMEVKSGYGLDAESELKILDVIDELNRTQPVELIPTFLGAHAFPGDVPRDEYITNIFDMIPAVAKKAIFCDVFCEEGYFTVEESRAILEKAKKYGLTPRLHAAQFTPDFRGAELAVEVGARSVDHLEQISGEEIETLARSDTAATLLPGVSFFLNYGYPPARKIIDSGCITAIATDFNPGSCMCISMQMVMAIACLQMRMTPEEALNAATVNAGYALGMTHAGSLQPGSQADLLIVDVPNYKMIPYFFGENHVETVIKKGEIVWSR